jgi:hypothetical protein
MRRGAECRCATWPAPRQPHPTLLADRIPTEMSTNQDTNKNFYLDYVLWGTVYYLQFIKKIKKLKN